MLDSDLRDHLVKRMRESNIDPNKVNIELAETIDPIDSMFQVTGIFDGALDAEFHITGPYEINVADWVAEFYEQLNNDSDDDSANWRIDVYYFFPGENDGEEDIIGDCIYRLTDEGPAIFVAVNDAGRENV